MGITIGGTMTTLLLAHIIAFSISLGSVPLLSLAAFKKISMPRMGFIIATYSTIFGFVTGIALALSATTPVACVTLSLYLAGFMYLRNYVEARQQA